MAISGTGFFENDDALDFLSDLDDEPSLATLTRAFDAVLLAAPREYLDVEEGGSAAAAVEVLVCALGKGPAVRPLRARTLALVRKSIAAQPAARRAWAVEKAQATLARVTGEQSELASQWNELSGTKRGWTQVVERRLATLARHHVALTVGLAKRRPKNALPEAFFDPEEGQWKVEPRDQQGRDHGTAMWYRADGTLETTSTYEHGVATGPFARYHESGEIAVSGTYVRGVEHGTTAYVRSKKPTSEVAFDDTIRDIVRIEYDYVDGSIRTTRWFDAKGLLVTPDGERWPQRPVSVPKDATFNGAEGWVVGSDDSGSALGKGIWRHGRWRFWNADGSVMKEVRYDRGRVLE